MTTQQIAICPGCGCDAMAETRSIKPSELPPADQLENLPSPSKNARRVFICNNCGTKFKRSPVSEVGGGPETSRKTSLPKVVCPKCGYSGKMWDSFPKETPVKSKWFGVRHLSTPADTPWVHVCIQCGKRFEQTA